MSIRLDNYALKLFGRKTLSIQLDITNSCNLRCSHCYHRDHINTGNLTFPEWQIVLGQYQSLLSSLQARPNVAICGGEPLVSPYLEPLLSEVTTRWPDTWVGIMTNGTKIERVIKKLERYPLFFQVSLESPNEEEHNRIRGLGTFRSALRGIEILKAKKFEVNLLVILSKRSGQEIDSMFALAQSLGVASLNYTRAISQGSGETHYLEKDSPLRGQALKNAITHIIDASKRTGIATNTEKPLFSLLDPTSPGAAPNGYDGIVVGYDGKVKLSSRADLKIGDVRQQTLEDIFFYNPLFRALRNGEIIKCGSCKFFRRCGGDRTVAYASTGNFLGPDEGCWL